MPEVLRVSNLRMSPSPIRTRLEAITQLVRKVFTRKLRLKGSVPDGAPEHQYEHDVRPLNVEEARRVRTSTEHSPAAQWTRTTARPGLTLCRRERCSRTGKVRYCVGDISVGGFHSHRCFEKLF